MTPRRPLIITRDVVLSDGAFYKDEGGRYVGMSIMVEAPITLGATDEVRLRAVLVFEDGDAVPERGALTLMTGPNAMIMSRARPSVNVDFRINVVSRKAGAKFQLLIEPDTPSGTMHMHGWSCVLTGVRSSPIEVRSKRKAADREVAPRPVRGLAPRIDTDDATMTFKILCGTMLRLQQSIDIIDKRVRRTERALREVYAMCASSGAGQGGGVPAGTAPASIMQRNAMASLFPRPLSEGFLSSSEGDQTTGPMSGAGAAGGSMGGISSSSSSSSGQYVHAAMLPGGPSTGSFNTRRGGNLMAGASLAGAGVGTDLTAMASRNGHLLPLRSSEFSSPLGEDGNTSSSSDGGMGGGMGAPMSRMLSEGLTGATALTGRGGGSLTFLPSTGGSLTGPTLSTMVMGAGVPGSGGRQQATGAAVTLTDVLTPTLEHVSIPASLPSGPILGSGGSVAGVTRSSGGPAAAAAGRDKDATLALPGPSGVGGWAVNASALRAVAATGDLAVMRSSSTPATAAATTPATPGAALTRGITDLMVPVAALPAEGKAAAPSTAAATSASTTASTTSSSGAHTSASTAGAVASDERTDESQPTAPPPAKRRRVQ